MKLRDPRQPTPGDCLGVMRRPAGRAFAMKAKLGLQFTRKQKKVLFIAVILSALAGLALGIFTDIGVSHCFTTSH